MSGALKFLYTVLGVVALGVIGIAEDIEARRRGERRSAADRAMGWTRR